ncbi:hypothetical protein LJC58_02485 [Lachnospiraceae bacterium OttesenSCG-928-D06]|nr:hypothetical protein [Lachnospiraceae bacterium OttesenSCG-928-D06]
MKLKIFSNWWLKILSIVLAFILWMVVVNVEDPVKSTNVSNIKVTLLNEELITDKNLVYEILDNTDSVKSVSIRAPQSVLAEINRNDIVATADFSKLTAADTIEIEFASLRYNTKIESITSNSDVLKLSIENNKRKDINLVANTVGEVAENYELGKLSLGVNRISISGPESKVNQVSYAAVTVSISDATDDIITQETIRLYDGEGNVIADDAIKKYTTTSEVKVSVLATKTVPLSFTAMGMAAEGYQYTDLIESSPESIKIAGSKQDLSGVTEIVIPPEKLNITGQSENMVTTMDITEFLPNGISLVKGEFDGKVKVTVHIEQILNREFSISPNNITITNIPENYEAELGNEDQDFTLEIKGLAEQVSSLSANRINGTVDIGAWMEDNNMTELTSGIHSIPVSFDLDSAITITEPVKAMVIITKPDESNFD